MRAIWSLLLLSACTFEVNGEPGDAPKAGACSTAIGAGYRHTCAIDDAGAAWCWGLNDHGQLGNGSTEDQSEPAAVTLPDKKLTQISGGGNHTCAIDATKAAWCWGRNDDGQLGNAQVSDSHAPVQVRGLTNVAQIATGAAHTCALADGKVSCWGNNNVGQLGFEGSANAPTTVAVPTAIAIAAASYTTCIIDDTGAAWCWGDNEQGQLGDGTTTSRSTPTKLTGLGGSGLKSIAIGGTFVCALAESGAVYCVGANGRGELGRGGGDDATTLGLVSLPVVADALVAGEQFACAIDKDARAWCWGYNGDSQLTEQLAEQRYLPEITSFGAVKQLAAGGSHLCALVGEAVQCAGYNAMGQLGNAHRTTQASAQVVPDLHTVTSVGVGGGHTCASLVDGTVRCWGYNFEGQLGDGRWETRSTPQPVIGLGDVKRVVAGGAHSCALRNDGTVACWGANSSGQLGQGSTVKSSVALGVKLPAKATAIAAGGEHTCALGANGFVYCWGLDWAGQVGDNNGAHDDVLLPVQVPMLSGVLGIVAGNSHTCAITGNRTVACWGNGELGQLGGGDQVSKDTPVSVVGATNIDQLASFGNSTCAHVMTDNSVLCWGAGNSGQIGDGDYAPRSRATKVTGLQAAYVAAGGYFSCATKADGSAMCWGAGYTGQLGSGNYDGNPTPVAVLNLATAKEIVAGDEHVCAILGNGDLACWGDGREGELGDKNMRDVAPTDALMTCAAE